MISTEGSDALPTMTMASQPQRLPARAKPLLASESLMRSVSGLLLTTANFADVVRGLPTSGLNTNTSGASGASGSSRKAPLRPAAAMRRARFRQGTAAGPSHRAATRSTLPRGDVDAEIAAVVAEQHAVSGPWCLVTWALAVLGAWSLAFPWALTGALLTALSPNVCGQNQDAVVLP